MEAMNRVDCGIQQCYRRAGNREEMVNKIRELYEQGLSQNDIAKLLSTTRAVVKYWMEKAGIKRRDPGTAGKMKSKIYNYNEDFFSVIDSYDKAYILGFITGDGCIHDDGKRKRLAITIAEQDRQIVEDIAKVLNAVELIKLRQTANDKWQSKVSLIINSTKMCNDLIKLGVLPNKTGREKWAVLENSELQWAYLRGLFDADGHIRVYYRNGYLKVKFGITKSESLLMDVKKFFNERGIETPAKSIQSKEGCSVLEICSVPEVKKIYSQLYTYGSLKLNRKYETFSSLMI